MVNYNDIENNSVEINEEKTDVQEKDVKIKTEEIKIIIEKKGQSNSIKDSWAERGARRGSIGDHAEVM